MNIKFDTSRFNGCKVLSLDDRDRELLGTDCKYMATNGKVAFFGNNYKHLFHALLVVNGK
jgi:hypothetical protein